MHGYASDIITACDRVTIDARNMYYYRIRVYFTECTVVDLAA